jgi:hypothetical protein
MICESRKSATPCASRERFHQPLLKPYTTEGKALWRAVQFTLASTSPSSRVAAARWRLEDIGSHRTKGAGRQALIATLSKRIAARKLNRQAGFNFFQWDEGAEWDNIEIERCQRPA